MNYQVTEYDCVPTTFINALQCLFSREELPPEVVQKIMLYSLDTINKNGEPGKRGTTGLACQLILQWLESYKSKSFAVRCEYLTEDEVNLRPNNRIVRCLNNGGVALFSVRFDNTSSMYHYILAIESDPEYIYFFDPYYRGKRIYGEDPKAIDIIKGNPRINLKVSRLRLESTGMERYSLGPAEYRTCCLLEHKTK